MTYADVLRAFTVVENSSSNRFFFNNTGGLRPYILLKKNNKNDNAPRASSAPPMPPQIAGMSIGVQIVRGRPASASDNLFEATTLKTKKINYRNNGGAEPDAPGIIIAGHPPSPCECNIQGAMIICRQCGAYCHDNCISRQCICATCLTC
ncbi:hypothetical protein TSAR_003894 [Trichomalopsis sarcophagae]|uniref:Protein ASX-like PHD domain-containing protein n=1 Tax=Trichomalopsis sarcophagae TaxID=543379 RepID=A0A232EZ70_9HYME|nr:hypothetical protein TSAR_003894 [Trichomalopsis sarcophagae]